MRYLILILLMIGFATAVSVDFDCPDSIEVDEEFECSLEIFDGEGVYDVKIDLDGERNSVLEVFNDGVWKSGYYYLLEFIEEGDVEKVRLKVSEDRDYGGVLKLRQGDKREFFDIEVEVDEGEDIMEGGEEIVEENSENEIVLSERPKETISLNNGEESESVYESKDSKIMNYLPYVFSVFLIGLLGILIWERF